jgi:hypothetical protein
MRSCFEDTSENLNSELDVSVDSSEIYGKSRAIGPSPIQNCDIHLYMRFRIK